MAKQGTTYRPVKLETSDDQDLGKNYADFYVTRASLKTKSVVDDDDDDDDDYLQNCLPC